MPRANLPPEAYFISKAIPDVPGYVIERSIGAGTRGSVYKARSEELRNDIACKIIPRSNLVGSGDGATRWKDEFQKANILRSRTVVRVHSVTEWIDPEAGIDCIVLASEFVDGVTLDEFIRTNPQEITVPFIEQFLREMFAFLYDMASHSVSHGDLHGRNIMVATVGDSLLAPLPRFRVTDFGVAATSDGVLRDDYEQIANLLRRLLETAHFDQGSPRERFGFDVLNDHFLSRHLLETDVTRDPIARRPKALFDRLNQIQADFVLTQARNALTLTTPFDYLSCEQLGDSHTLLKALYSHKFLGLEAIERRNNLIVTGPRGCGKSTVFKSLSLMHRELAGGAEPETVKYVGVYYRCDDLYFAFPRFEGARRDDAIDIPIHYLTATLLAGAIDSLTLWASRHFAGELSANESTVVQKLWQALGIQQPRVPGSDTFAQLSARLERERRKAVDRQRFVNDATRGLGQSFGAEVLARACEVLREGFSFLRDRPFFFLIDDYSSPKITTGLQENLNRVLMQRSGVCFFKLATESPVSCALSDIDGKAYVEGREFEWENLGLTFLHEEGEARVAFIADVLERRLTAIKGYPVSSLLQLIGHGDRASHNQVALAIRASLKQELHGIECLGNVCSGDIHFIINVVGKMVDRVGGSEGLRSDHDPKVPAEVQNKAIRDEAGRFLNELRGVKAHGEQLVAIVTAFGNVAHSYLRYRNAQNETAKPPHQASRIEPYEQPDLSPDARRMYEDLIRFSVFLLDMRGKSRRGQVVPRLILRRFLVPHFNLTFSLRDSMELENADFEMLLTNPARFEGEKRFRKATDEGTLLPDDSGASQ